MRCGLVRCSNFELHVKDRRLALAQPWALRGFVGTWAALKHAVLYEVKPVGQGGLLPTFVKVGGAEVVGAFRGRVAEKRLAVKLQVAARVGTLKGFAAESKVLQGLGQRINRFRGKPLADPKLDLQLPPPLREASSPGLTVQAPVSDGRTTEIPPETDF